MKLSRIITQLRGILFTLSIKAAAWLYRRMPRENRLWLLSWIEELISACRREDRLGDAVNLRRAIGDIPTYRSTKRE